MQDVQFGELKVFHMVEAGENEDGELGRDWEGKASVWGTIGSHRRFHTGNDMVRSIRGW